MYEQQGSAVFASHAPVCFVNFVPGIWLRADSGPTSYDGGIFGVLPVERQSYLLVGYR